MILFNLKEVLKKKDITLTELAQKTNLSINTLSLLSTRKSKGIQFDTLDKIINALDCKVEELLISSENFLKLEVLEVKVLEVNDELNASNSSEDRAFFECRYLDNENRIRIMFLNRNQNGFRNDISLHGDVPVDFLIGEKKSPIDSKRKMELITIFIAIIFKKMVYDNLFHLIKNDKNMKSPIAINMFPYYKSISTIKPYYNIGKIPKEEIDQAILDYSFTSNYFKIDDFKLLIDPSFYKED